MIGAMVVAGAHKRSVVVFGACLVTLACGGEDSGRDDPTVATTTASTGSATTSVGTTADTDDGPMATSADTGPSATSDVTTTGVDSSGTEGVDTGIPPNCGDGNPDPDEACDDANQIDADGCNVDCTVSGSVLWSHSQAGGLGADEDGYAVAVADDGAAFVAGTLTVASADFFVRGYDPEGGLDWSVAVDGASASTDIANALVRAGDQLYAAGQLTQGAGGNDVFVANYALSGAAGWTAAFNDPINGADRAFAVTADATGNVGVAGDQTVDLQGTDVFVRVYNSAGSALWSASYTSAGAAAERAHAIAADASGNFVVAGYETVGGQRDMWIRKYDPAGSPLWTQGYAGVDGLDDQAMALTTDAAGDIFVAGFESTAVGPTNAWLRRLDLNGNEQWTQTYAGSAAEGAQALGVALDAAGDVTIVGFERVGGLDRILLRKYDGAGVMKWTETIEGAMGTSSYGRAITVGPDEHLWIAGGIDLGVDGRDVYIAKIAR